MARVAVALPRELADRLSAEAVRHGHEIVARCSSAAELRAAVASFRPVSVLAMAHADYLTDDVLAVCDDLGAGVIALVSNDAGRRHAASLGLFETVDAEAAWPEIERVIGSVTVGAPSSPPVTGSVIAVWGPAGSPGRTTLAISIAAELAALGHSVALADVDTHGASVAPALGLLDEAPGFAAACRLAGSDTLTHSELERIGQRYESAQGGFWVLTGIGRASRWPELPASRVAATIAQCRTWVEYTVLDTASSLENDEEISSDMFVSRRNAATITALAEADHVVAVGAADPVGLSRFLRSHVDVLEVTSAASHTVVMNRIRATAIGMNPQGQVTRTLSRFAGIDDPVLVPHDQAGVDGAVLSGKTLADSAPRSAARLAIKSFVVERLQSASPHEPRSRRWRRAERR